MKESGDLDLTECLKLKCHVGYGGIKSGRPWITTTTKGYSMCQFGAHLLHQTHHPKFSVKMQFCINNI